jgi:conserved oligomeric Golgi complex subunit 3
MLTPGSRLYRDQLALTERHLDTLVDDANAALKLLTNLSNSFKSVEVQTTTFQSQCEDLLSEQMRLQKLADEVGTDLYYYTYLDNVTRRLNAPGAGRLVDDPVFGEVLHSLNSCIAFMLKHVRTSLIVMYGAKLTAPAYIPGCGVVSCAVSSASNKGTSPVRSGIHESLGEGLVRHRKANLGYAV